MRQEQIQTQQFRLRDLIDIEFDNELKAKKTRIAEILENEYEYFKVEVDESKYTLTIFVSDYDESITIVINKMMYDYVFVIDCYIYKEKPFYHIVPFDKIFQSVVVRIEDGTLSVLYDKLSAFFPD